MNNIMPIFFHNNGKNSAGAARNIGLTHATGRWLIFADADDFFLPEFLPTIMRYADSDDVDMVYFRVYAREGDTLQYSKRCVPREYYYSEPMKIYLETGDRRYLCFMCPPHSKMILRSFVTRHCLSFEEVTCQNDKVFIVRCNMLASKIAVDNDAIYCWAYRTGSLSDSSSLHHELTRMRVNFRAAAIMRRYHHRPFAIVNYCRWAALWTYSKWHAIRFLPQLAYYHGPRFIYKFIIRRFWKGFLRRIRRFGGFLGSKRAAT